MEFLISNVFLRIDVLFLVVLRLLGFFVAAPIFSGRNVPTYVKIGLSFIIATLVLSTQDISVVLYEDHLLAYTILIVKEFMIGVIIGFTVYLILNSVFLAGQLMDFQIGFSMVNVLDPLSEIQVPITGNFYYFLVTAMLLAVNGHHTMFRALFYSYEVLPVGQAILGSALVAEYLRMIGAFFVIAFTIASPVVGAIFILDVALGILTKAAPQMNIFVVGLPLKLILGILTLIVITPMFVTVSDFLFNEMYKYMFRMIEGMIP